MNANNRLRKHFSTIDSLATFGHTLIVIEIVVLLLYAIFVRSQVVVEVDALQVERVLGFMAVSAMAVGFGIFSSFGSNHQFTPVIFSLLALILSWQLHILIYQFWLKIMTGFNNYPIFIHIGLKELIRAGRCGLGLIIGLTAAMGRIIPKDILKITPVFVIGYTLTEVVIQNKIQATDPGGSIIIFAYSSIFALVFSFILGKKIVPKNPIEDNYRSQSFALIGTFLLWTFWPPFSLTLHASTSFQRTLAITNTIFSMAGSTITMTALTSLYKQGISMLIIHRATIVGGVAIGSSVFFVYFPAVSLAIGAVTGVFAFFSLRHLQGRFQMAWGLYDTCGIMSFGLLPSIIGTICGSLLLVAYFYHGTDSNIVSMSNPHGIFRAQNTYNSKGGLQVGALFTAIGLGVLFGLIAGFLVAVYYRQDWDNFYQDEWHFDVTAQTNQTKTQYNLQTATRDNRTSARFQAPESDERFQTHEIQQSEYSRKKKKKFKTRYNI